MVVCFPSKVLHRDLKSSNLLCDEAYCVKIADFGMSRLKASASSSSTSSANTNSVSARHNQHRNRNHHSQQRANNNNVVVASTRLQQAAM
jgi:serine/threonine protein kinase